MRVVRIFFDTFDFAVCDLQRDMGIQRFVSIRCGDLKDVLFAFRNVAQRDFTVFRLLYRCGIGALLNLEGRGAAGNRIAVHVDFPDGQLHL